MRLWQRGSYSKMSNKFATPKRIKMILPVPVPEAGLSMFLSQYPAGFVRPDVSIDFVCAREGGTTIDSLYEATLADAFVLEAGARAEEEGYAAVCLNTMSDSGLSALRSRLTIPVVGPGQSSQLFAASLGKTFSVITMWDRWRYMYEKTAQELGITHKLASIRSIDTRPDTAELLAGKEEIVFPKLEAAARRAIEEDGADVILLGSTTMHQSHAYLAECLPVPVINPGLLALRMCETMLDLGLSHSKRAYPSPERANDDLFAAVASRL